MTLATETNNTGQISGNPILAGSTAFTVEVQDSDSTPQTESAQYTIVVTSGNNSDSLFSGSYTFLFQGFDSDGPMSVAGTLTADGNGNITSGDETSNRASGIISAAKLSGSYTIGLNGADGRGTLHLIATPTVQAPLELDYQLVLESDGTVRMIENNDTNTNTDTYQTHGSGVLKPVNQGSFAVGDFSGNYAFEFYGDDYSQKRMAIGGVLHGDGESKITPITADLNDAGSFAQMESPSGAFSYSSDSQSGAATLLYTLAGKAQTQLTFAFYFVSSSDIYFTEIDVPSITDQFPRLSGEAILQQTNGAFAGSAMSGSSIVTASGVSGANASVMAGLLTAPACDGVTADASLSYDQNNGGTVSSVAPAASTCIVASNGRTTFSSLDPRVAVAYLTGPGQGFILGSDAAVTTGLLELQTPSTFATTLIDGSYALSSAPPGDTNAAAFVGQVSSIGNGNLPGVLDEVDAPGAKAILGQSLLISVNGVAASGRGTMQASTSSGGQFPTNLVFYMLSNGQMRIISLDSNPGNEHPVVISLNH